MVGDPAPYDAENVLTNFDPALFDPARAYRIDAGNLRVLGTGDPLNGLVVAGQDPKNGNRVAPTEWGNFGPRLGFWWDPFSDGRTAVRGGYGMYFDRTLVGVFLQNAFINPPFVSSAVFNATGAAGNPTLSNPRGGAQRDNESIVVGLFATSPDFKVPTTHQFSIGVQRELPWNFNMDVSYVGTRGRDLLRTYSPQQNASRDHFAHECGEAVRGYGNITFRDTSAETEYDSLQVSVLRRFAQGLQVSTNYTLSRAEGNSSSDRNAADLAQDPRNLDAEWGLMDYDRTHIFGLHYVWELPFFRNTSTLMYNLIGGWEITGSTRLASGVPLTITQSANSANSFGGGAFRPDLVGNAGDLRGSCARRSDPPVVQHRGVRAVCRKHVRKLGTWSSARTRYQRDQSGTLQELPPRLEYPAAVPPRDVQRLQPPEPAAGRHRVRHANVRTGDHGG